MFTGSLIEREGQQLICGIGRDITEQQRSRRLARLLQEVAAAANEAEHFNEVLQRAVGMVCTHTGWPVGHVYVPAEAEADTLAPTGIWNRPLTDRFETFRAVTEKTWFARGEGLT